MTHKISNKYSLISLDINRAKQGEELLSYVAMLMWEAQILVFENDI